MKNTFTKHNITKFAFAAALMLLAMGSCISDGFDEPANNGNGKSGTVRFTLAVPGLSVPRPSTRAALSEDQEKVISRVDVLAFYRSGSYDGKLAFHRKGKSVAGTANTFEVELPEGSYDLVVYGNAAEGEGVEGGIDAPNANLIPKSTTREQAAKMITFSLSEKWGREMGIPTWGYRDNVTVDQNTSLTGGKAIDMHRMVARIDVKLSKLAASGIADGPGNANFELTSVYHANRNTIGQGAPNYRDVNVWRPTEGVKNPGKGIAVKPSVPDPAEPKVGMTQSLLYTADDGLNSMGLESVIYTFEYLNGGAGNHSTNPCIIIGGKYQGDTKESFYRLDLLRKDGGYYVYLDLLRNHHYTLTINKVTGRGYDTPEEAFASRPINIEMNTLVWEEAGSDVVFNGQYYLSVSQGLFEFDRRKRDESWTDNKVILHTDYQTGWTAKVYGKDASGEFTEENPDWLDVPVKSGSGGGVRTVMSLNPKKNPATGALREAQVVVTAGTLRYLIKVSQSTDAGLFIEITDPVTGEKFDGKRIDFDSQNPVASKFNVSWGPSTSTVTITKRQMGIKPFEWKKPDNNWSTIATGTGSHTFTINPDGYTPAPGNLFDSRIVEMIFTVANATGTEFVTDTIKLFQGKKYNVTEAKLKIIGGKREYEANYAGIVDPLGIRINTEAKINNASVAVPWMSEYSYDGGKTWSSEAPDWYDFPATYMPTDSDGGKYVEIQHKVSPLPINVEKWSDENLKTREPKSSNPAEPTDLSKEWDSYNHKRNTANCYMVGAPGYYSLPLVYGNAINNGNTNESAWKWNPGTTLPPGPTASIIRTMKTFDDHDITKPYILDDLSHAIANKSKLYATLVWSDSPGLVKEVRLIDDTYPGVPSGSKSIAFYISREDIRQGNAVVALIDGSTPYNKILWSWHIWITDLNNYSNIGNTIRVKAWGTNKLDSAEYHFMSRNLGWVGYTRMEYGVGPNFDNDRSVKVRISQIGIDNPAKPEIFTLTQKHDHITSGQRAVYYQWGRKDPMPSSQGESQYDLALELGDPKYAFQKWNKNNNDKFSLGEAIQYPYRMLTVGDQWQQKPKDNLWNNAVDIIRGMLTASNPKKTIYDPSPVGYKIPPAYTWWGFIQLSGLTGNVYTGFTGKPNSRGAFSSNPAAEFKADGGHSFYLDFAVTSPMSHTITFAAGGSRQISDGKLEHVNTQGTYWSATPGATHPFALRFDLNSVSVAPAPAAVARMVRPMRDD